MEMYPDIDPFRRQLFKNCVNLFSFILFNVIENKNKY